MARAPEVFSLEPAAPEAKSRGSRAPAEIVETVDFTTQSPVIAEEIVSRRRNVWLRLFFGAFGALISLAIGLWAYDFIVDLMLRWPVLGYAALALAGVALVALMVLLGRELSALARLGSAETLRQASDAALEDGTVPAARKFINDINGFYAKDATTAGGRTALDEHSREIIDGPDLVALAERELLTAKDKAARAAIASAASKVAMVTTLSPRAWVDIGFVLFQSVRLIGTIATLYNGRPGGLAIWRLSARVMTHLAITGGVAVAQDALSQMIGAGLAGRLSSKLGEGVLNGVLTARVGLSAIAVCRPMRFRALAAPTLSDVAGSLMPLGGNKEKSAG